MSRTLRMEELLSRWRRLPLVVALLTLVILAVAIAFTTRQIRDRIREQIINRDGAVLHGVMMTQLDETLTEEVEAISDLPDPLMVVLVTSRLRGVLGTRLLDAQGQFLEAFPPLVRPVETIPVGDLAALRELRPVSHFQPMASLSTFFYGVEPGLGDEERFPLLEVTLPVHRSGERRLLGLAQFLIDGETIAGELRQLDRHLIYQSLTAFLTASVLLLASFAWAFYRLRRTHQALSQRTQDLLEANEDLARTARTAALGAVTSHLIHGLKSPLAGLQQFVANQGNGHPVAAEADWEQAVASTRRMQNLIGQVVNVLREEETSVHYQLALDELAQLVSSRVQPLAEQRGVHLTWTAGPGEPLSNRTANLVGFVLVNLLENAVEATPSGGSVFLNINLEDPRLIFEVRDEGEGFPESATAELFTPRRSSKEGGSGIGLAICKQLAAHLGAELELRSTTTRGSILRLTLPLPAKAANAGRNQVVRMS